MSDSNAYLYKRLRAKYNDIEVFYSAATAIGRARAVDGIQLVNFKPDDLLKQQAIVTDYYNNCKVDRGLCTCNMGGYHHDSNNDEDDGDNDDTMNDDDTNDVTMNDDDNIDSDIDNVGT